MVALRSIKYVLKRDALWIFPDADVGDWSTVFRVDCNMGMTKSTITPYAFTRLPKCALRQSLGDASYSSKVYRIFCLLLHPLAC